MEDTTESFEKWLTSLGLECYSEVFQNAHLDFKTILQVSDDHLKELKVSIGHRVKLRSAIDELSKTSKQTSLSQSRSSSKEGDLTRVSKSNRDIKAQNRSNVVEKSAHSKRSPPSPPRSGNVSPRRPSPQSTLKELELVTDKSSEPAELTFKVLVVGDAGTGKSSLIHRYQTGKWNPGYKATIGSDFCVKEFLWNNTTNLCIHFWDIAGQERFANLTGVFYRHAQGAIVAFDVTNPKSFQGVAKWKADLDAKVTLPDGSPLPVVLFANKVDLLTDAQQLAELSLTLVDYCKEHGFKGPFFTSAKTGYGIENGFFSLVETMLPKSLSAVPPRYPNAGLLVAVTKQDSYESSDEYRKLQEDKQKKSSCAC